MPRESGTAVSRTTREAGRSWRSRLTRRVFPDWPGGEWTGGLLEVVCSLLRCRGRGALIMAR
ncbi:hypothetical protein GCM10010452_33100 [Crossiella cryophila]